MGACSQALASNYFVQLFALYMLYLKYYVKLRTFCSQVTTFLDEVTILHRLTESPYVIQLLGLCTDPGHYAIVMEYVEKGDLEEMLISDNSKHSKIREWSCRRKMSLHIAKGMDFLHSHKPPIIHRDLKTSNVVVDRNYCCKVEI